jgi:hypothetical protein
MIIKLKIKWFLIWSLILSNIGELSMLDSNCEHECRKVTKILGEICLFRISSNNGAIWIKMVPFNLTFKLWSFHKKKVFFEIEKFVSQFKQELNFILKNWSKRTQWMILISYTIGIYYWRRIIFIHRSTFSILIHYRENGAQIFKLDSSFYWLLERPSDWLSM